MRHGASGREGPGDGKHQNFIVVEEVIPESQSGGHTDLATMGLIFGFIEIINLIESSNTFKEFFLDLNEVKI